MQKVKFFKKGECLNKINSFMEDKVFISSKMVDDKLEIVYTEHEKEAKEVIKRKAKKGAKNEQEN